MRVEMVTKQEGYIMRVELVFYGGHHISIGDAMRVEAGLFNGDHHLKKETSCVLALFYEW